MAAEYYKLDVWLSNNVYGCGIVLVFLSQGLLFILTFLGSCVV